jgi:hypothetical protein
VELDSEALEPARERLVARFGDLAGEWWEGLQETIDELEVRWDLRLGQPVPRGGTSLVVHCRRADGRAAILKLTPEPALASVEASALRAWAASKCLPELWEADASAGALLLEAIRSVPAFARLVPEGVRLADAMCPLGPRVRIEPVPVPHDCGDGFLHAYWRRPEAYLEPAVRHGVSVFRVLDEDEYAEGLARLAGDLESGAWAERHADLLDRAGLDLGYRLVVADLERRSPIEP